MRKKTRKSKKLKKKQTIILTSIIVMLVGVITFGFAILLNTDSDIKESYINKQKKKETEKTEEPKVKTVDANSKTRPFAVMINNLGAARPYHTGLQNSYLVYEIIVEGGITRYMALFKDTYPETVGSVRSARHYYLDYAMENDAYYVHWGWSPQAESDISSLKINNISGMAYGKPYFFRKNYPVSSEHRGFVNLKEMLNLVDKKGYRKETNQPLLLKYSATPIDTNSHEDKKSAKNIDLKYSDGFTTNYVYDSTEKVYKQYVNKKEHTDYETKKQYTVKNIITYQVKNSTIAGGGKGRQEIDNIGSGNGYYITNGEAIPITWSKGSRSAQTIYKYKDGTKITVNDGNTWIHIVPTNGKISIS